MIPGNDIYCVCIHICIPGYGGCWYDGKFIFYIYLIFLVNEWCNLAMRRRQMADDISKFKTSGCDLVVWE